MALIVVRSAGRPSRRRSLGQGLTEFALVLPVMLLVLFAIFDLGRAVYAYSTLSDAARTGSRLAIVDQDITLIQAAAVQQAAGLALPPSNVDVQFLNAYDLGPCSTIAIGSCVAQVTVHYTYTAATPIISNIVGTIAMASTTRLPVEALCKTSQGTCPQQYP